MFLKIINYLRLYLAKNKNKKYILHHKEKGLWRIQACKDFSDVKKGDFGGLIQKEDNLSHYNNCWIYDNSMVFDSSQVYHNAKILQQSIISNNSLVFNNSVIRDNSIIKNNSQILGNSIISKQIIDYQKIYNNNNIDFKQHLLDFAEIFL